MSLVWINGTLVEKSQARVSPFDHGFLYGDGVWEHLRVFNGKLFRHSEHFKLLFEAVETIGIRMPLTWEELITAIQLTLEANTRLDGYVRVIVTSGPGTIGPDPRKLEPQVIIIAEEYQPFPRELYDHGLHAQTVSLPIDRSHPLFQVRSLSHSHIAHAKRYAIQRGCLEAVMELLIGNGATYEATEGLLLVVRSGHLVVPQHQLSDVTGAAVAGLAREVGLSVTERSIARSELYDADELLLAGTACGVIGIVRLDDGVIGAGREGPITQNLRTRYAQLHS